ncbi:hypothetical protein EHS25_003466 [Saitozyma podzolica]|uniref:Uncharacterized protein n=1 Tax=Saitozyma podzolica TaxID=1890683 RepID=A0A427Y7B8_9TREE|nr:hypothetical protein EHS25_003466 [Saitozyma podzolica]
MSVIAQKAAKRIFSQHVVPYQPSDPLYEETVDAKGKKKRVKRAVPPGLSKRDQKALLKIRKRAHYLDKGMSLCGFRVGWTFFIGIIPGAGDIADATLNYCLVVRPAKKLDIPQALLTKMLFNNAVSAGVGLVPLVGDVALAAWKANSRNAHLLEAFLTLRGQEYLASIQQGASAIPVGGTDGVSAEELRRVFGVGAGMEQDAKVSSGTTTVGNGNGKGNGAPPPLPPRTTAAQTKKGWGFRKT